MIEMHDFDVASSRVLEWAAELQRAFDDLEVRKAFEMETGAEGLPNPDENPRQVDINRSERYFQDFRVWATRHLGIADKAPSEIRIRLAA